MLKASEDAPKLSKEAFELLVPELRVNLLDAQSTLRERGARAVLVILTGDDRIGCDEVYDRLHEWLDARWLVSRTFADPAPADLERPFAYRFWRELPPRGRLGLFFGAWPEAAVLERCRDGGSAELFEHRAELARDLERELADDGTVVVKLWIHLSKKRHLKRLERARRDPTREVLVEEVDHEILESLDEALPEVERYLEATDAPRARWHVIAGADEQHRDLAAGRLVLEALRAACGPPPDGEQVELPPPPAGARTLATVDLSRRLDGRDYEPRLDSLQARLAELTRSARRAGVPSVLAFEGWDAAGKGGAIRRLTRPMAARDYRVIPVSAPTPDELARHYLWRFWRELPRAGRTVIFDRSWYGRVLVERVEGLARADEWRRAYGEIADFERQLVEGGIVLVKFWLHIDADEQLRRFRAREETPYKHFKVTDDDYRNRRQWPAYVAAVDEMLARTDRPGAPWTVIAGEDKHWARVRVLETVVAALEARLG